MTEEEAKTKWCPMVPGFNHAARNRQIDDRNGYRCIASACMMWRTTELLDDDNVLRKVSYCGLAGKP